MNAFIVRPFGKKQNVDFDRVERELIGPALDRLQVTGRTTAEITRSGNIRADMIHLLLTADLVIADISIHNANVFYELGVRHALRDKRTFLLRASIDEVPFDIKTDRYLSYDQDNPATSLDALVEALDATLRAEFVDSPVYGMLPGLEPPDAAVFIVVPRDFREEVERASDTAQKGDLRFLASELDGLPWRREGLRVVGQAQFNLADYRYAAETWEWVRKEIPNDVNANLHLGTCYQKLNDLVLSDEALERVADLKGLESEQLAEARALLGSNAKTRWLSAWEAAPPETRQAEALCSPYLFDAFRAYRSGFETEPRHYYSGLNALALAVVVTELAGALPDSWTQRFDSIEEAAFRLREYRDLRVQLAGAVEFSLRARQQELIRTDESDPWLASSFADLAFLTCRRNILQAYREALATLPPYAVDIVARQYDIFSQLNLLPDSVKAAAPAFQKRGPAAGPCAPPKVLVFTGHRIDDPGRAQPRFPASCEGAARDAIRKAIQAEMAGGTTVAFSGGASGGDLLFQEICEELGIERNLYLIIPREDYIKTSVAQAGPQWIARFDHQYQTARLREYQRSPELPVWLRDKGAYGVWQRSNTWMLHNGLARGNSNTTLLALWNGAGGDGPGGTEHMVRIAQSRGARTVILNSKEIFGL